MAETKPTYEELERKIKELEQEKLERHLMKESIIPTISNKIRILYIGDYQLDRELVKDALEKEHGGFEVTEVSDKYEFEALLKNREFDVVLSDFNIAGLEGLQVIEAVHAHDPGIPVIIVTGTGSEEIAVMALKQGASDYVIKRPRYIRKLSQTILAAIEKQALKDQRQKAEFFLKESEKRYRLLFENMMNGYVYCKMIYEQNIPHDYIYLDVNRAFETTTGLKNVLGKKVSEVIPGILEKDPELIKRCGRVALTGKPDSFEIYLNALSKWFSISVYSPEKDHFVAVFDVIDERKRIEEELKANLIKYQTLFESLPIGVTISDKDGKILESNKEAARLLALPLEEHIKRKIDGSEWRIIRPNGSPMPEDEFASVRALKEKRLVEHVEMGIIRGDEDVLWINVTAGPILHHPFGVIIVYNDITERKKMEEALHIEQERFSKAFCASPNPMTISRMADGTIIEANEIWIETFGYSRAESVGTSAVSLGIWGDPLNRQKAMQKLKETGSLRNYETDLWCKTGKVRHVLLSIESFEIDGQQNLIAIVQDITERKKMEDALWESERRLNLAQRSAGAGVWEWDIASGRLDWSRELFILFGLDPDKTEPIFDVWDQVLHPDDKENAHIRIENSIKRGTMLDSDYRVVLPDGQVRWIKALGSTTYDYTKQPVRMAGICTDITERKKMEEELLKSRKLESVGVLAGGIAHDFNNILTTIIGNIALARMQVKPENEIYELLSEAEAASARAQKLTGQLLTFSKGGAPLKEIASIKDILKESCSFVLRGSKADCEYSIAKDLWPAEVDTGQISQVIHNLVINANQAMPEGGMIQIAAENLIIDDSYGLPLKPGGYIRISIKDQGVGISEKHFLNIFDPYFTTKQQGSGLGLATTYSIIKKHDGHITLESQIGIGTIFYIYLPASEKTVSEKEEIQLVTGHGRILVMDDEVPLRKMVGRMLKSLCYESEFAKNGSEAIKMYKEAKEAGKPYDAVILDLTIPGGMGGKEAIKKLLEIDPEIRAIVSSGYSNDPVLANFLEYGFKGIMPKPFETLSLSIVLQEVLKDANNKA